MHKKLVLYLLFICFSYCGMEIPDFFVSISDVCPSIIVEMRYYTPHNFVGGNIMGYDAPKCLLTREAAFALCGVQKDILLMNKSLKVYDCYRPKMSVDQFVLWANNPDTLMKGEFYPELQKDVLIPEGYISATSSHSRGSTVDLTIVDLPAGPQEEYRRGITKLRPCFAQQGVRFLDNSVDMGTGFDCFSPLAHTDNCSITPLQKKNRYILKDAMTERGFINLAVEWWHYTLANEPFPHTAFDFPIE